MSNCRLACSHVHLPGWSQLRINNHSYYFVVKNHNTKHIKEWLNLRLLIRGPISYKNTLKILCGVCIHNLSSLSFLVPVQNSRIITINGKPFVSFLNRKNIVNLPWGRVAFITGSSFDVPFPDSTWTSSISTASVKHKCHKSTSSQHAEIANFQQYNIKIPFSSGTATCCDQTTE